MTQTGWPGISSNSLKPFDNGHAKTRLITSNWRIHSHSGNATARSKHNRRGHQSVFIATQKITNHQNVEKSPHQPNAENFCLWRSSDSIALVCTNYWNAKVLQHVNTVAKYIIRWSAAHQRRFKPKEFWQLIYQITTYRSCGNWRSKNVRSTWHWCWKLVCLDKAYQSSQQKAQGNID